MSAEKPKESQPSRSRSRSSPDRVPPSDSPSPSADAPSDETAPESTDESVEDAAEVEIGAEIAPEEPRKEPGASGSSSGSPPGAKGVPAPPSPPLEHRAAPASERGFVEMGPPHAGEPEHTELLGALAAGLTEVLPGLEILDRDLVFEQGGRADLAGVDGGGRLVLVLVVDANPDLAALEVLDTHSLARRHADTIARHLVGNPSETRIDATLEPRTIVIDPAGSERLLLRLGPILESGIELFALHAIRSAAGERAYLAPLTAPPMRPARRAKAPEAGFLDALPPALAELGRAAVERLGRLDRELVVSGGSDAISWSHQSEVLVRLERVGNRLQAGVGPHLEPRVLESEEDLEPLLESALALLVQWLDYDAPAAPVNPLAPPGAGDPILTREEIEAFRD